ncbi:hypothetical protein BDZ94DRAFT_1267472 [Collybia nuda]|uniref:Homeobox domain-containing protein n=1 Tax=Collybia nuda TaxID=64659 RepID=A0A9P6CF38_9AGAR|nr:hypothetical protein BDZ94DRAFT_1267472 [Collybia nuda]
MDAPYLADIRLTISSAERIKTMCKAKLPELPPTPSTSALLAPPTLVLPVPQSITTSLLKYGCSTTAARSLSDAFIWFAHEIRASYESIYQFAATSNTHSSHLSNKSQNLSSKIQHKYRNQLLIAKQRTISRVTAQSTKLKSRPVFNQEYVPLLEAYFMYNAYPSACDRAALAKKSMMTPRQIEVWFQNHRNRLKKEGVALRRLICDPLPLKLSIKSLEKAMPFYVIPEKEYTSSKSLSSDEGTDKGKTQSANDTAQFSHVSPPHAFPTKYSPLSDYEPFPDKGSQYKFPEPSWIRKPAQYLPRVQSSDVNSLVSEFAKLVITDSTLSGKPQKRSIDCRVRRPWVLATYTKLPLAPHPALIRTTNLSSLQGGQQMSCALRSSSPDKESSLFPEVVAGINPTRRRVARLPRRAPIYPSVAQRGSSPAVSDGSSRSFSSSTRTSSFTSLTSLPDGVTSEFPFKHHHNPGT